MTVISMATPKNVKNCQKIVQKIVQKIIKKKNLTIEPEDFTAFRAINKSERKDDKPPLIIVAFRTNTMKNDFRKRNNSDPRAEDFDKDKSGPIFINENLTPKQSQLFRNVRQFKKDYKFTFAWTRDGVPQLRETETSTPITIRTQHELDAQEDVFENQKDR